jgi:hypothetical protein
MIRQQPACEHGSFQKESVWVHGSFAEGSGLGWGLGAWGWGLGGRGWGWVPEVRSFQKTALPSLRASSLAMPVLGFRVQGSGFPC